MAAGRPRRRLPGRALCAVGLALLWRVAVGAHEPGTTRVSVLFEQGRRYDIEIVTDASALVEKLEASAGRSLPAETDAARLQTQLQGFDGAFRRRVRIAFDGSEPPGPTIRYAVAPALDASSAAAATIRLTGEIPPGAHQFWWTYAWTFTSYELALRNATGEQPVVQLLEGEQVSAPFALTPARGNRFDLAWRLVTLGFAHIVPNGVDDLLFVLGIYLLSNSVRSALWQISAFTLAQSVALGLSLAGLVGLSAKVVEPLIAFSIAYVAVENLCLSEPRSWRVVLVFAFGLLHGIAVAPALEALSLPRSEFVTAVLSFNVGIETGQLAVIGAAVVLIGWHSAHSADRAWYRDHVVVPASALIACTAVYWTIARLSF